MLGAISDAVSGTLGSVAGSVVDNVVDDLAGGVLDVAGDVLSGYITGALAGAVDILGPDGLAMIGTALGGPLGGQIGRLAGHVLPEILDGLENTDLGAGLSFGPDALGLSLIGQAEDAVDWTDAATGARPLAELVAGAVTRDADTARPLANRVLNAVAGLEPPAARDAVADLAKRAGFERDPLFNLLQVAVREGYASPEQGGAAARATALAFAR